MLNNFIGGGQVFLHKIRMFQQVFMRTLWVSLIIGTLSALAMYNQELKETQWQAFYDYRKAILADEFDSAINSLRETIGKEPTYVTYVSIKTKSGKIKTGFDPRDLRNFDIFQNINRKVIQLGWDILVALGFFTALSFSVIFILWSRFGKNLKADKIKEGENKILTAKEVRNTLRKMKAMSDLVVGDMPLIKNMETRHFLVTGSTGSGKTNLMHNMLPQIERRGEPAIVIDNTGEMIAKYYNPERGDVIFNPMDARSNDWDFWSDCSNVEELERFSKILFSFNRKSSDSKSDPFWEQSAEIVFNECVKYLTKSNNKTIESLQSLTINATVEELKKRLVDTPAARYLTDDSKGMSSSVLSTLATNTRPITYLNENSPLGKFSLKKYFKKLNQGSNAWLFLSTKPSSRNLTLPLIACLTELSLCQLLDIGINNNRRLWFVIDELPSLGKLPALSTLMSEGRKYGSCIMCGMQSLNQLYSIYGQYEGSTIFGQFGTRFFFRNTENLIARQISESSGMETITRQQKNTSFGANEFRDGVSYNEHQQKKPLIETSDLSSLATGSCYVFLPEPEVRIAKINVPHNKINNKHSGFIQKDTSCKKLATDKPTPPAKEERKTESQPDETQNMAYPNKGTKTTTRKKKLPQKKQKSKIGSSNNDI